MNDIVAGGSRHSEQTSRTCDETADNYRGSLTSHAKE